MSSELAAAQAYAREVEAQRVQAQQPLFKGNGSDFDQSFSAAVTTGLPESYGLAGSYGAARGSDQSLLFGRGYGLFGNPNTFSQSGLATPIGSVQAMPCPQVPFESMTLGGTCVMRPVATDVGTSGAAAAGSGAANGGAPEGSRHPGGPPGDGNDSRRGGHGGDRGHVRGGGGGGDRPPRPRGPASTPEKRATRGGPDGGGGDGGPPGPGGDDDQQSQRSDDSEVYDPWSGKRRNAIDPLTI
jgi:hypothetical protein